MKLKELQKTVNVAWSPAQEQPIYLVAGTAAQQLDASSNANIEIFSANLSDPGYDLILRGSQGSPYRYHKLVWSPLGIGGQYSNGVIVGGCEGGHLVIYNANKLLNGEDALLAQQNKHSGPVRAIDFNPFQSNLLASGASESEILIWDLNNTTTPMNPGTKTQPYEDIQNVGWNKQVQHILASVFSSRCVIWDLRKNEPIIKLSDSQSRVRWRAMQWHPDVATQLWLASEEDQAPYVQLWDLRYATSPAKTIQIHQRGVLGLSWCPKDTDLMVSCGKDNKIMCWNPNTEIAGDEILSEVASTIQWYSDVQWCPKNPAIIASSSLDGIVSIYSLHGGVQQQVQTTTKIADSFPGMESFPEAHIMQSHAAPVSYSDLKKPPKWMKKPIGAVFGFGGKLISFNNIENSRIVTMKQIITEPELIERSNQLENVLTNGNFKEYCLTKTNELTDEHKRFIWRLLDAYFEGNAQTEMVNVLGYNAEEIQSKLLNWFYSNYKEDEPKKDISRSDSSEVEGDPSTDESTDLSGLDNASVFDGIAADNKYESNNAEVRYKVKTDDDDDGMICQALLTGNIEMAVNLCMNAGRHADAIIIAMTGGSELLARTQHQYLKKQDGYLAHLISALVTKDWSGVVSQCTTDSWKDVLVGIVSHSGEQMPMLCECLAERLLNERSQNSIENAILCFICAGNVEKVVETWQLLQQNENKEQQEQKTQDLQELVEIVMLLHKAVELQGRNVGATGKYADLLARYASLLAAQGALNSALAYLMPSDDPDMIDLRERLYYTLGHKQAYQSRPSHPQIQKDRFGQQRQSITNPGLRSTFNAPLQPQPPTQPLFPAGNPVSAPVVPSWSNQPLQQQQQQPPTFTQNWNSQPIASNPLVSQMPTQAMPNVGPPPVGPPLASDPLSQPARPPSVGSQGLPKSKYVLDPSVQSGSGYGQTSNLYTPQSLNPYPSPQQQQQQQQPFTPPVSSQAAPNQFVPFTPAPLANTYMSGIPPIEVAQQALPPQQTHRSLHNTTPPTGWNDPPPLKPRAKHCDHYEMSAEHAGTRKWARIIKSHSNSPKHHMPDMKKTENIEYAIQQNNQQSTTPFGQDGNQPNGIYDPTAQQQYNVQQFVPTISQPQPYQRNQPNYPTQSTAPHIPQSSFQTNAIQQSVAQQPPKVATPEPPKQKLPIPEEYVYMQTVFNELRLQCVNTASNPQTKRKLDDVGKRLESLFDLLRENRLSQNTLSSLVQLVQFVQNGDYANGLGLHTQMVSGPDFSQIASFMPGIKVLLQSALQLQVYLR